MFYKVRAALSSRGPTREEIEDAKAEIISRASRGGVSLGTGQPDDYPALFAEARKAQAATYITAAVQADRQTLSSVVAWQLAGLRSRFAVANSPPSPSTRDEALAL